MAVSRSGVYVVLDVELIDNGVWLSLCFLTARYPTGEVMAVEEFYVDRSQHEIKNPTKKAFWEKHAEALDYNLKRGMGKPEEVAEASVCAYVQDLRARNPHFFLVSDNPGLDILILDTILAKYNHEPLSQRAPDVYAQVLCTWSYKQSLARIFHVKTASLFTAPFVKMLLQQYPMAATRFRMPRNSKAAKEEIRLPHTVLRDCSVTLATFFRCLDLTAALSQFVQYQETVMCPPRAMMPPPPVFHHAPIYAPVFISAPAPPPG